MYTVLKETATYRKRKVHAAVSELIRSSMTKTVVDSHSLFI